MENHKKALVTGITGQDGAYLAQLLLQNGYEVAGLVRHSNSSNLWRLNWLNIADKVKLLPGDLSDSVAIQRVIREFKPHEVYNLGAQSFVKTSYEQPLLTADISGLGAVRILEAIRIVNPEIRFYQASSCDMFGLTKEPILNEKTPFHPSSPYAVAKLYAHWMTINYRENYRIFACTGILFNHESPLRGFDFVMRKISRAAASIKLNLQNNLKLGYMDGKRDWGHAKDYVKAMWLMMQHDKPDDYVIASGRTLTVRELCEIAFNYVGLNYQNYVEIDPVLLRPIEIEVLHGDATKAENILNWKASISTEQMLIEMVETDLQLLNKDIGIYA